MPGARSRQGGVCRCRHACCCACVHHTFVVGSWQVVPRLPLPQQYTRWRTQQDPGNIGRRKACTTTPLLAESSEQCSSLPGSSAVPLAWHSSRTLWLELCLGSLLCTAGLVCSCVVWTEGAWVCVLAALMRSTHFRVCVHVAGALCWLRVNPQVCQLHPRGG